MAAIRYDVINVFLALFARTFIDKLLSAAPICLLIYKTTLGVE
jgi:hypothetical protein